MECETDVPSATFPKDREVALRLNAAVAAFNCSATLFEEELAPAVKVAVWAVLTEATLAVKEALEVPDATDTLAGTVTALLLLDRVTL